MRRSPTASFSGLSSLSSSGVSSQAVSDNSFLLSAFQEGMSLFPGNGVQGQVCGTRRDRLLPRPWLPILEMASQVSNLIWMCLCLTDQKDPRLPHQRGMHVSRSSSWTVLAIPTSKSNLLLIVLAVIIFHQEKRCWAVRTTLLLRQPHRNITL